ncbi:MAG: TOBE domain-containing protein, partial [Chloroflexota bacterium]
NTPKTAFVASFVGTLNLLEATVQDARSGLVAIDDQVVSVGKQIDASAGQKISLALRPEAFTVVNGSAPDAANTVKGTIEDTYFLGSVMRLRVCVGAQRINADIFNNLNLQMPQIGQTITLSFMPEACMIVEKPAEVVAAAAAI